MYTPIILNCILLISSFLWVVRKKGLLSIVGIVYFFYAFSALCGLFILDDLSKSRVFDFSIYATLYFFIAFVIYTRPLFRDDSRIPLKLKSSQYDYNSLVKVYIVAAVLEVIILIPKIRAIDYSDIFAVYRMAFDDAENHQLYDNALQGIIINIVSYLRLPMIVVFFNYLTQNNVSKTRKVSLLLAILIPNLLYCIKTISRANLVLLFFSLFFCYLIFKDQLSLKVKRTINIALVSLSTLLAVAFTIMTIGRFEDESKDSALFYFGHSMLYCNGSVITPSEGTMKGEVFFEWFYDKFGIKKSGTTDEVVGTDSGSSFKTFIGSRYVDFGAVGALLYGILLSSIILAIKKKNVLSVADVYIYLFYVNWIFVGLFYDSVEAINWIMVILIYVFLKSPIFKKKNGTNYSILSTSVSPSRGE